MKYVAIALGAASALLVLRAMLFRTLHARLHTRRTFAPPPRTDIRARLLARLAWPAFLLAVAATLVFGVLVGSLVGPN